MGTWGSPAIPLTCSSHTTPMPLSCFTDNTLMPFPCCSHVAVIPTITANVAPRALHCPYALRAHPAGSLAATAILNPSLVCTLFVVLGGPPSQTRLGLGLGLGLFVALGEPPSATRGLWGRRGALEWCRGCSGKAGLYLPWCGGAVAHLCRGESSLPMCQGREQHICLGSEYLNRVRRRDWLSMGERE